MRGINSDTFEDFSYRYILICLWRILDVVNMGIRLSCCGLAALIFRSCGLTDIKKKKRHGTFVAYVGLSIASSPM